jgi:hypothetical protein
VRGEGGGSRGQCWVRCVAGITARVWCTPAGTLVPFAARHVQRAAHCIRQAGARCSSNGLCAGAAALHNVCCHGSAPLRYCSVCCLAATHHAHCEALCAWLLVMMAMDMPQKCAAAVLKPCLLTSSSHVRYGRRGFSLTLQAGWRGRWCAGRGCGMYCRWQQSEAASAWLELLVCLWCCRPPAPCCHAI